MMLYGFVLYGMFLEILLLQVPFLTSLCIWTLKKIDMGSDTGDRRRACKPAREIQRSWGGYTSGFQGGKQPHSFWWDCPPNWWAMFQSQHYHYHTEIPSLNWSLWIAVEPTAQVVQWLTALIWSYKDEYIFSQFEKILKEQAQTRWALFPRALGSMCVCNPFMGSMWDIDVQNRIPTLWNTANDFLGVASRKVQADCPDEC